MNSVRFKLCVMMFLEFFIWGAWFELGFDYIPTLGFEKWQQQLVFAAFNFGALVALFFSTYPRMSIVRISATWLIFSTGGTQFLGMPTRSLMNVGVQKK